MKTKFLIAERPDFIKVIPKLIHLNKNDVVLIDKNKCFVSMVLFELDHELMTYYLELI